MMGRAEPLVLRCGNGPKSHIPRFISAAVVPDRGMKVLQARAFLPGVGEIDLLHDAPFGGALLVPFANRIRGRLSSDGTAIDTSVLGRRVRLPANWSGREAGAERCAMHGLMLDTPMQIIEQTAGSV